MENHGAKSLVVAVLVIGALVGVAPVEGAMKITSATIPLPTDEKPTRLASLWYGLEWKAEITSIRLDLKPEKGADPVRPVWVVTGSSSRPQVQKVIVQINLLDSNGKSVGSVKKYLFLKAITENQEFPIKMKAKAAAWEKTVQVKITATFTVL